MFVEVSYWPYHLTSEAAPHIVASWERVNVSTTLSLAILRLASAAWFVSRRVKVTYCWRSSVMSSPGGTVGNERIS